MVGTLWKHRESLGEPEFLRQRGHLEAWLDRLLSEGRTHLGDVAIQRRIGKRRGVVLGCLDDPAAEPTNNRAERSLRPAVIARKVSCGNKTESGKSAWKRLTNLALTCEQRGHDFVSWLATCLPLAVQVIPVPPPAKQVRQAVRLGVAGHQQRPGAGMAAVAAGPPQPRRPRGPGVPRHGRAARR
ncbi:MAG: Transposase family [Planctomycetota bacterium]|nr:Transposase family [Planctomycetota bacterium]